MYLILRRWSQSRRHAAFFADYADEFRGVCDHVAGFLDEAKRFFPILQIMIKVPQNDPIDPSLAECRRSFKSRVEDIHRELADFMARALLACERGNKDVIDRLKDLGFVIAIERSAVFDVNRFVSIAGCIFVLFLGGGALIGSFLHQQIPIQRLFAISLMLATTYGAAIACAIVPKQLWSLADIDEVGHRPAIGYLASGLLALAAAGGVSLLFNIILAWDVGIGFRHFGFSYPWLAMSFVAACLIAFQCDDYAISDHAITGGDPPCWLRWAEAGSAAIVLMAASMLVREWLSEIPDIPPQRIPDPRFLLPIQASLGLLIGAAVPHWYRGATGRCGARDGRRDAAMPPPEAVPAG